MRSIVEDSAKFEKNIMSINYISGLPCSFIRQFCENVSTYSGRRSLDVSIIFLNRLKRNFGMSEAVQDAVEEVLALTRKKWDTCDISKGILDRCIADVLYEIEQGGDCNA